MNMTEQPINSGVIDTISNLLSTVGKTFGNLAKAGIELGKISEENGVNKMPLITDDGDKFIIKWKWQDEGAHLMKILVKDNYGNEVVRQKVKINSEDDVFNTVADMILEGWDIIISDKQNDKNSGPASNDDSTVDDSNVIPSEGNIVDVKPVGEARKLTVTLQRVCGATEDSINLINIYGNYAVANMQADLDNLLDNDDMLSQITEDPITFEVTDNGNEFNVDITSMSESECFASSLISMLTSAFTTVNDCQAIHWNAKGEQFHEIHSIAESALWACRYQIDTLAELCVELTGSVPHPSTFCAHDSILNTQSGFEGCEAINMIRDGIRKHVACLEFYLPNFSADVQSMINTWIREMKHLADYSLDRQSSGCQKVPLSC